MADTQREIERRERRARKDRKNKIIVWSILAVVIIVLAVMRISEVNFSSIGDKFTDSNGKFSLTNGVSEDNFPFTLDSSQKVSVTNVNNKLGVLTPSSFTIIDSKSGSSDYVVEHGYSNPIMKNAGIYTLTYDQGMSTYRLDNTSESVYEEKLDKSIFCADVSKNADVAVATTSNDKLCNITVYNKSLKKIFEKSESSGYPVSVSLSENGKKIAYALVYGKNANLSFNVYIGDVKKGTVSKAVTLPSGSLLGLKFNGSNLYVIGDTYVGKISSSGEYADVFKSGEINTLDYTFTPSGELAIAYNAYTNSTDNMISVVKSNGSVRQTIKVKGNVKSIAVSSTTVSVLTSTQIISYSISKGEETSSQDADDSIKSICLVGSKLFVQKQSLIDKCEAVKK